MRGMLCACHDGIVSHLGTTNRRWYFAFLSSFLLALHDLMFDLHNLNDSFEWHAVA